MPRPYSFIYTDILNNFISFELNIEFNEGLKETRI